MAKLTRLQIKTQARQSVRAYLNTPNEPDPWLLDTWVDNSVEDLCRGVDAIVLTLETDIVANQGPYPLPDLYFYDSVRAMTEFGVMRPLWHPTMDEMTAHYPHWQSDPEPAGNPFAAIIEGSGRVILYPTPNYAAVKGLEMTGFGVISNEVWPLDTNCCPLPARTHPAVRDAVIERYWEWVGTEPARLKEARRRAFLGAGMFEREMATLTDEIRSRTPRGDSGYHVPRGPLNQ